MRAILCLCLLCLVPVIASAKPNAAPQQNIKEADELYLVGRFDDALLVYQAAYQQKNDPVLLFKIARCQQQLKQYQEAADNYRAFLDVTKDQDLRSEAERLLAETESFLPKPALQPEESPPALSHKAKRLFIISGATGAASVVTGAVALSLSKNPGEKGLISAEDVALIQSFALASDLLLLTSIATGAAGLAVWHKDKKSSMEVMPLVAPEMIGMEVRW